MDLNTLFTLSYLSNFIRENREQASNFYKCRVDNNLMDYLREKGVPYKVINTYQLHISYEHHIFNADNYYDWLNDRGCMSLNELKLMESIVDMQYKQFVLLFSKDSGPSLAFTRFPKRLIGKIASYVFGSTNIDGENEGFCTCMETFQDAKSFRSICKSIHTLYPQQKVAEMYIMNNYEELQVKLKSEFNTLIHKESAMNVSSIYQLSDSDVRHCVVQTLRRPKQNSLKCFLQGDLIRASNLKFNHSHPRRLRNLRFRVQNSESRMLSYYR